MECREVELNRHTWGIVSIDGAKRGVELVMSREVNAVASRKLIVKHDAD
jgi:hypothetical protein